MLELYHWEPNIFFLKPLVALAEKGEPYTAHYFDPTSFHQFGPDFPATDESNLQLEREGPVLVDDGTVIASSFFMLEYIAEAFSGPALMPSTPYGRYLVHAWGQTIALSVANAVAMLGCARHLAPVLRSRPSADLQARLASIEPLERRIAWTAVLDRSEADAADIARAQLVGPLRRIDAALGATLWLAGPEYSIADIDAFAMLAPLPELAPDLVNANATPYIAAFLTRMQGRPAVRAALALTRTGRPGQAFVPGPESARWG
jgi:GST-like protein